MKRTYHGAAPDTLADEAEQLADKHGGYWLGEHPDHPVEDWQYEVRNNDTRLGYWQWVWCRLQG